MTALKRPGLVEALLLAVTAFLLNRWAQPLLGIPGLETIGLKLAALALLSGAVSMLRYWHRTVYTPWTLAAIWPLFMLLGGVGVLWISGFALAGPLSPRNGGAGARYMGQEQMLGLYLAAVTAMVIARYGRHLLESGIRFTTHVRRSCQPIELLGAGTALLGMIVWVGHPKSPMLPGLALRGLGQPHVSGEALRLLVIVGMAWWLYRYTELPSSLSRKRRGLLACGALVAAGGAGLIATGDRGPLQVVALQLALVLLVGAVLIGVPQLTTRRAAVACLALAGVVVAFWWAQTQIAPSISTTAAARELARQTPESAASSNYLQMRWLLDAATPPDSRVPQGFGLGKVPFCGARAWMGRGPCSLTSGAPIQLPSDFPVVGLMATWGLWPTAALVGLLLLWLRLLACGAEVPYSPDPVDRFRAWLVALLALSLGIQALLSVAGALGWALLTGITLPLLGYGKTSLVVVALTAGLALMPTKVSTISEGFV